MKTSAIFAACLMTTGMWMAPHNVEAHEMTVQEAASDSVYDAVDKLAQFPGGEEALMAYLEKNLTYPEQMRQQGKSGRVMVSFVITRKGKIEDVRIRKTPDEGFNETVIQLIQGMPKWKPAKVKGKKVSSRWTVPILFRLP
ncbi:MAG TPA: hypothetical protein DDW22_07265 [Prevotellaceae bacterium]|nr:hypothetical protein [Prevotellaceae bacterium]